MKDASFETWVKASHKVNDAVGPGIPTYWVIQGLGRIYVKIISCGPALYSRRAAGVSLHPESYESIQFNSHSFQAYLWILGAYEVVRMLDQIAHKIPCVFAEAAVEKLHKTKLLFERTRVPFAKGEPSHRHKDFGFSSQISGEELVKK